MNSSIMRHVWKSTRLGISRIQRVKDHQSDTDNEATQSRVSVKIKC